MNSQHLIPVPASVAGRRGFTLLEVLVAMSIFAIGFVAVAALFPAASVLQKKTVDDLTGQQVGLLV